MSKKVIAINSSARKKNTYNMLTQLKEKLENEDIEVDIVNLFDYDIQPCLGCQHCLKKGDCILKDDVYKLMKKIKEYDGIIPSTPVYMNNVSGKLKVFADRTCTWFHRPELEGKPVLLLTTTAGSGLKKVLDYLENLAVQWGAFPVDKIERKISTIKNLIEDKEYSNFVKHLNMDKINYKPKMNQLMIYQVQRIMAQKLLLIDKEYWIEKGWIDKNYFYDCNINISKKIISSTAFRKYTDRLKSLNIKTIQII